MSNTALATIANAWAQVSTIVRVPRNETEYKTLCELMDELLEVVSDGDTGPYADLLDTVSTLVESYENEHYPMEGEWWKTTD